MMKIAMASDFSWKLYYASLDSASKEGECIARTYGFSEPPVDPFSIVREEKELIYAEGYDFGNAFDGRIKYVGPRFLISYNTRYNSWDHSGDFHSKILFTIAHELGHFFLPKHREYLVGSKRAHGSFSEFTANPLVEKQADFFASGLLMPGFLLRRAINQQNFVSLMEFLNIRRQFQVSLTGMMVRWVQLSDFPCATIAIRNGKILYGWLSKTLREHGAWRLRKGAKIRGRNALEFVDGDPQVNRFRKGEGSGAMFNWIDFDNRRLPTQEFYFAIPHSQTTWVLAIADENDLTADWSD